MRANEQLLSDWAESNDINQRTAQGWAKSGKIKAERQKVKKTVVITRMVDTYVLRKNTKVPGSKSESPKRLAQ